MKKSLPLFFVQAQPLVNRNNNRLSALLRLSSAITCFLVLTLYAPTASGQNTKLGTSALGSNTSGFSNSAFGDSALYANTTGFHNTAIGFYALLSNTTGAYNTAVGGYALYHSKSDYNTAIGYQALAANSTGYNNTASGMNALKSNTTGYFNLANGFNALASNTTGSHNTANGTAALFSNATGTFNTANGYSSLYSNTTGDYNAASGSYSLYSNTTGLANTANGIQSLYYNTTGTHNTANGYLSLYSNTTGYYNVANGVHALYSNTTGIVNMANGVNSLIYNTTGSYNNAGGYATLFSNTSGGSNTAYGNLALYNSTTGNGNTANGGDALLSNKTGNGNTGLGFATDVLTGNLDQATAIGYGAVVDASYKVRVGNTIATSIGGQVGWTTFSDGRYKKDIRENVTGLAFINSLRPVTYTVDIAGLNEYFNKGRKRPQDIKGEQVSAPLPKAGEEAAAAAEAGKIVYDGFIAQEVEEAANKLGIPFSGVDKPKSKDGLYGLRYDNFVPQLVKAVQELSKMNDEKEAKIDALQSQLNTQQKQLDELKALVLAKGQPAGGSASSTSIVLSGAALEQNTPNPFDRVTTIAYTLPQRYTRAQIAISDQGGTMLQQVDISGSGKGTLKVDAGTLAAGAYNYSLVVDGQVIGSKRMVLAR